MTPIKFTMPTEDAMGEVVKTNSSDAEWYNYGETYETRKWANAETKDGSMWVWIPRYAYKIDSTNQKIDVKFLIGLTDNYYKEDGSIGTAQRQTEVDQTIDTSLDYTVHPAFTDESKINFANGGWDSELTGIWVAKFEAGYASGNNDTPVKASNVNYTQTNAWVANIEAGTSNDNGGTTLPARNWLDGIYGSTETSIKYPTFQGTTYVMNYINHNDSYNISKALIDSGNIYGFSNTNADSHLVKNSEWGAIAYLSQSKYGQEGIEIKINNINLNSGGRQRTETSGKSEVDSVYAVTGCTSNSTTQGAKTTTISEINGVSGDTSANGVYVWNQLTGQKASTTGTIYGIYDLSGGLWERIAAYIPNENDSLKKYGESIAYKDNQLKIISTKYAIVYPYNSPESSVIDTASQENFKNNTKIYGDSVRETAYSKAGTGESGWNTSSWNSDSSYFLALNGTFFVRGGTYWHGSSSGIFNFTRTTGTCDCSVGFRAVVIPTV